MNLILDGNIVEIKDNSIEIVNKDSEKITFKKDSKTFTSYYSVFKDEIYVQINGMQYKFQLKEEDWGDGGANSSADSNISSPMPGTVVEILVKEGDEVEDGKGVIIVEAMKMETTLYAAKKGKVSKINVSEKEQIDADQILVEIDN